MDRQRVIQAELEKLLAVGFIREVEYLEWLANVVVVLKREANDVFVSITPTWMTSAQRIASHYLE